MTYGPAQAAAGQAAAASTTSSSRREAYRGVPALRHVAGQERCSSSRCGDADTNVSINNGGRTQARAGRNVKPAVKDRSRGFLTAAGATFRSTARRAWWTHAAAAIPLPRRATRVTRPTRPSTTPSFSSIPELLFDVAKRLGTIKPGETTTRRETVTTKPEQVKDRVTVCCSRGAALVGAAGVSVLRHAGEWRRGERQGVSQFCPLCHTTNMEMHGRSCLWLYPLTPGHRARGA